jgi:hypothetical protein
MLKNNLQHWSGETIGYKCRSSKKLFADTSTSGLASVTVQCMQLESIGAWWSPLQVGTLSN